MSKPKLFFVSRAFPPVIGGIETHNHELSRCLSTAVPVVLLANRRGKKALPWFFIKSLIMLAFMVRRGDVVLLGDGVLAPVGWLVGRLRGVTVVGVVHGLDVTYASRLYQRLWVRFFLPRLTGLVAVSQATRDEALRRGLDPGRVRVVPNGVDPAEAAACPPREAARASLLPGDLAGRMLLVTVGRLVRRKGVAWFVEQVVPGLPPSTIYAVAGDGPEAPGLRQLVERLGLGDRVWLLGRVSPDARARLLAAADVFIQPNIEVPGDVEGFGIAVIEASSCGTPVLAARLQGLCDAVLEGRTGSLLPSGDAAAWQDALGSWSPAGFPRAQVAAATLEAFAWPAVSAQYLAAIRGFVRASGQAESLSL